jgi:hypothetical protein
VNHEADLSQRIVQSKLIQAPTTLSMESRWPRQIIVAGIRDGLHAMQAAKLGVLNCSASEPARG